MSEKFCLKWNDYISNWNRSLTELRNDADLADVTLISEDKVRFSAHKVILSSCSNIFKLILKGNTHSNSFLYLSGVSSVNLKLILDYIYHGEVNLFQEQLDSFLESAQKLEVEGLLAGNNDFEEKTQNFLESETLSKDFYQQPDEEKQVVHSDLKVTSKIKRESVRTMSNVDENKLDVGSMTPEEIEIRTSSIYEKKDGGWNCLECGYSTIAVQ